MDVEEVAKAVLMMAELPPEANVLTMTVMANGMPLVGRG
jgi:NADP-dependent 3-hydroxy acid dehydrogenase YdfG